MPGERAIDSGELRAAAAAVLAHDGAWRDADPRRKFTAALHELARVATGGSLGRVHPGHGAPDPLHRTSPLRQAVSADSSPCPSREQRAVT
ncbi:MAG TPA: hypothetical protein VGI96_02865 [Streptosporangiaceae bacterium]